MSFPRMSSLLIVLVGGFVLTYEWPAAPMPALVPAAVAKESAPPTPPVPEAPFVKLPATKTVRAGRTFYLCPKSNCKALNWTIPDGLEQDTEIVLRDKNAVALVGDNEGIYTVLCNGALGDVPSNVAACVVTVGTPAPPVPPPPPVPPNPFTATLQAAYALDKDADRATSLAFLQQVYAGMASQAEKKWADVKTNADALVKIEAVVQAPGVGLTVTHLVNLRKAIAADFAAKFGTTATTPIALVDLAAELKKIAGALKGVQ